MNAKQTLDSLTVAANTISISRSGKELDTTFYQFDAPFLILDSSKVKTIFPTTDSLDVFFRVLPYNIGLRFQHLDSSLAKVDEEGRILGLEYDPYAQKGASIIEFRGLDYNGQFARGISFGNNQNLVLNSNFNLQLAGNLGDGVEVLAAISDNNIPLQPEGNTQQLNEFDKIFIQLSKGQNKLIAGDYELGIRQPQSYFLNYFKKLQGATFSNTTRVFKGKGELSSNASIAISRGRTNRQNLSIQEGNQGPYRLEGAEGERFIIVLAGTEKVWIDGKLLKRGLENDYIIDYNAGDITFTPRQLITREKRVIVEFEYAVDNYTRSMYAANITYRQGEKFRMYFNLFSEQDGKQPLDNEFSEEEQESLFNAGDDFTAATTTGINRIDEFSSFRVMYELIPNPEAGQCGAPDSILVFSTNPDSARYVARFSLVGAGQGFYTIDESQFANGTVYKYAGCESRGDYIARISIITPKQQQLYTLGAEYELSKKTRIRSELAMSNTDLNRLSPRDDGNNLGIAAATNLEHLFTINKNSSLDINLAHEFVQDRFEDINPYRTAEFNRDWNIGEAERVTEHLARGNLRFLSKIGRVDYRFSGFFRDSLYTGTKHVGRYSLRRNGLKIELEGDQLNTSAIDEESRFFRPKFDIVLPFFRDSTGTKFWSLGANGFREKNERYKKNALGTTADTLSRTSFFFDEYNVFIATPEDNKLNLRANFKQRIDYLPIANAFEQATLASEVNLQTTLRNRRKNKKNLRFLSALGVNFTYRQLSIKNTDISDEDPKETFLGRLNYNWNIFNGAIQTVTTYEVGSGQERKIEFFFEENREGTGAYIWNDYDQDSIIQVSEVEIAPFGNGNIDRFVRYTDEFIQTNNVILNQSLRLEPKAIWFNAKKSWKKVLSKFSTQSSLQITRKVRDIDGVSPWNPLELNISDTSLVATNANIRNTLFFNRADPKFDVQIGMSINEIKSVLSSGFDSRRTTNQFLKGRWNITKAMSFTTELSQGNRQRENETTVENNFDIDAWGVNPAFSWQPNNSFRIGISYDYETGSNNLGSLGEQSQQHDFAWNLRYNKATKISIDTEVSFVKVDFKGEANSAVGFALLNGLQNGNNFLWTVNISRQLARNIQLNIGYEGRKTGEARVIHVGRAQMAAQF